jgi:predicted ATPase
MITRWTLENFKPIRERLDLPTAPLTVLAGLNSSGKSSFLQSILLISQTLANQKLDEPLVLNGSLMRFGTFQDVCNDRATEQKIRIGFTLGDGAGTSTLFPGKNGPHHAQHQKEPSPDISIDMQFEAVSPKDDEATPIKAVRAALKSVELRLISDPSVSVDIRPASSAEEDDFSLSSDGQIVGEVLPHPSGQNYVARIRTAAHLPVDTSALADLAHMVPRGYVSRPGRSFLDCMQSVAAIKLLVSDPALALKESTALRLSFLLQTNGIVDDSGTVAEVCRAAFNARTARLSMPSWEGSNLDELIEWFVQNPPAIEFSRSRPLLLLMALFEPTFVWQQHRSDMTNEPELVRPLEQAARHIVNTLSSAIRYLGPLRADPYATQSYSPSGQPDDVGSRGEYAAAVYAANHKQPIRWWNPVFQQIETATLEAATDVWLKYLGVADHVSTREAAMPGIAWMVRSGAKTREKPLQAVGVGVSQVLPILVAGLLAPEGTILIMEQPELHLHERPQARLGEFFYGLTRVGKQVFIETHSAVLISQLRYLMVKRGQEAREAIAIYFVEQDEQGDAHFAPIQISKGGAIENWPDGFFDESFRQEDRITQEGIRARGKRANA